MMKKTSLLVAALFICLVAWSQGEIPLLGTEAPSFKGVTTNGDLDFPEDFGDHWKILLSHPKDFTQVCTSEILVLARMQEEFKDLGVKLAVISTDDLRSHFEWKRLMEDILLENGNPVKIEFPFIEDNTGRISNKYGMLHAWEIPTRDVRGVFIISPDNIIQSVNFYPLNIGRNMEEIKRVVMALQTSKEEQVYIPANWEPGDDVMMRHVPYSEQEMAENPDLKDKYYKVGVNMWFKKNETAGSE